MNLIKAAMLYLFAWQISYLLYIVAICTLYAIHPYLLVAALIAGWIAREC